MFALVQDSSWEMKRENAEMETRSLGQKQSLLIWAFLGGSVVKNLPANAWDMGSIPGLGRSHMPQGNYACALEPWATTTEAQAPRAHALKQENRYKEKHAHCN